ncbi:MAG: hypothetical protein D6717_14140, partial [Gammaproteobacteria bacterium]
MYGKKALPQIYLRETGPATPAVFLPESGESGAATRLKWLVSTCLAGVVGVAVIGVSVYASLNMDDGSGMVSSIRRASLAAMQPVTTTRLARRDQKVAGRKTARIQFTDRGLATKQIIHETVEERVGDRDYIKIKPYARVIARLATVPPKADGRIPPFNPFKLYANPKPLTESAEAAHDSTREVTQRVLEYEGSLLPVEDSLMLSTDTVAELIAETGDLLADGPYAMRPGLIPEAEEGGLVHKAAYRPDAPPGGLSEEAVPPRTTIVEKSWVESEDEIEQTNAEVRTVTVKRGDTLTSILTRNGAEPWQAKAIYEAMQPVFSARDLRRGQQIRFTLVPASSDSIEMEPVRISIFSGAKHEVTVARNADGTYVASDEAVDLKTGRGLRAKPQRATLYTSFYDAALNQNLPPELITKVLRIHSYDVDFKRPVRPGDTFEVFFDLKKKG